MPRIRHSTAWVWMLTRPGTITRPGSARRGVAPNDWPSAAAGPTAAMRGPSIATTASAITGSAGSPVSTVMSVSTRSVMPSSCRPQQHVAADQPVADQRDQDGRTEQDQAERRERLEATIFAQVEQHHGD